MFELIKRLRRNHAIEHATAAVLMTKHRAGASIAGIASTDGFHIYSNASNETVTRSAEEGLTRLKEGERNLAVSPFCGTNLATAAILAGFASMLTVRNKRVTSNLSTAVLTSLTAIVLAQPLGRLVQKHITTSADVSEVHIIDVTSSGKGKLSRHKIKTLQS